MKIPAFSITAFSTSALSAVLVLLVAAATPGDVSAQDNPVPTAIAACLDAFGEHPFGSNPSYRTLPVKVKVFGIGKDTIDDTVTSSPELIYIRTGVNVAGGSAIHLNNPRGWYCMRSAVNVMGGLVISIACDAKFVMLGDNATVLGGSDENTGVTVMGGTTVRRRC